MNVGLHEATRVRLLEYRDRWRALSRTRAGAWAVLWLVLIFVAAAGADAAWRPAGGASVLLSLTCYAAVLVAVAWTAQRWFRSRSLRSVSREVEAGAPQLRERLLSAVELAEDDAAQRYSSPAFQAALQHEVALDMVGVQPQKLLPARQVRRSVTAGGLALVVFAALCCVPVVGLPGHLLRVLWPWSNWGRMDRCLIRVVAPDPASGYAVRGESVDVVATVIGALSSDVRLEWRDDQGASTESVMQRVTPSPPGDPAYSGALVAREPWIEYRVRADNDFTPWYRVTCVERPVETAFGKRYRYPAYTQLEPHEERAEHGDLHALIGTQVLLEVTFNVPVERAALVFTDTASSGAPAASRSIALSPVDATHWNTELTLERSGKYRLELEATDSQLTNKFGRSYAITAVEDLPPRVEWLEPTETTIVVIPDSLVPLQGSVEDELPVESLRQWVRVPHGQWEPVGPELVPTGEGARQSCAWSWDLLGRGYEPGTMLKTRLTAVDRKGQETKSRELSVVVARARLESEVSAMTQRRLDLVAALDALAEEAKQLRDAAAEAHQALDAAPQSDAARRQREESLRQYARQTAGSLARVRTELRELTWQTTDLVSAEELQRIDLGLARIHSQTVAAAERDLAALADAVADTDELRAKRWEQAEQQLQPIPDLVTQMSQALRTFTTHDVLTDMARSGMAVRDFQQASLETRKAAGDHAQEAAPNIAQDAVPQSVAEENFRRQQQLLVDHLRRLSDAMTTQSKVVRDNARNVLRDRAEAVRREADRIEGALQSEEPADVLATAAREALDNLQHLQMIGSADSSLAQDTVHTRRHLDERIGTAKDALLQAADAIGQDQPGSAAQALAALDILPALRQSHQTRPGDAATHAADVGDALRAAQDLVARSDMPADQRARTLRELAQAMAQLEAAHLVASERRLVAQLARAERWTGDEAARRFDHPRNWDAYNERLERTVKRLRQAAVPEEIVRAIEPLQWSPDAGQAGDRIGPRRWDAGPMSSAAEPLERLAANLAAVEAQLAETVRKARAQIAAHAPSVSELARRAARQSRATGAAMDQLEEDLATGSMTDMRAETGARTAEQSTAMAAASQPLRDALTDLAARQDLLDTRQRNRARDADIAGAIVDEATGQVQDSLAATAQARRIEETTARAEQSAITSRDAAAAFDVVADHFARDADEDLATAATSPPPHAAGAPTDRTTLQELLARLAPRDAHGREYSDAERLAELAANDPASTLRQLEQELQRNPDMRRELSHIAQRVAQQSVDQLQRSAQQERNIQEHVEDSQAAYQHEKTMLERELAVAATRAESIADRMRDSLPSLMEQAPTEESREALQSAEADLRRAGDHATADITSQTAEGMRQAARDLAASLRWAEQVTRAIEQDLDARSQAQPFPEEDERRQEQEQMEGVQRHLRAERQRIEDRLVQQREQQQNRAQSESDSAASDTNTFRARAEAAAQDAQKQPDSAWMADEARAAQLRLQNAQQAQQLAADRLAVARQKADQARAARDQRHQQAAPALDRPHPAAQLGQLTAGELREESGQTASEVEQLAGSVPRWQHELEARRGTLAQALPEQQQVGRDVAAIGRDLARAAAHEQRLGRDVPAEQLADQARQVEELAQGSVQAAEDRIREPAGDVSAMSSADREQTVASSASAQAQSALARSAADLAGQAAALDAQLLGHRAIPAAPRANATEANTADADAAESTAPLAASLPAPAKARLLDEIDRRLREPRAASESNTPSAAEPQRTAQTLAEAAEALAARLQQARTASRDATARSQAALQGATRPAAAADGDRRHAGTPAAGAALVDPNRIDASGWNKLRRQAAEESTESLRESVAPGYRQQVDDYFRAVGDQTK